MWMKYTSSFSRSLGWRMLPKGATKEKTAFLKQLAETNYLLVTRRLVPDNYVCECA